MNSFGYIKSKFCAFIFAAEEIKEADSEPFPSRSTCTALQ